MDKNTVADKRKKQRELDVQYLKIAKLIGEKSKCLSIKIGAVLVKDGHLITTGYNGPAKGMEHCNTRQDDGSYAKNGFDSAVVCPRRRMGYKTGEGMEHCPAVHAEINTICQAARFGVSTEGSTLYAYCGYPCTDCAKEIINAGIKRVVVVREYESRPWALSTKDMFKTCGVMLNIISEGEVK